MEHTHFETGDLRGNIVMAILGASGAFWGSILMYGEKVLMAAILGFVGAAFGIVARLVYQKWFKKYFEQ